MTQKPMLRGEVGARALRNPVEEGGGGGVYGTYKRARRGVGGRVRMQCVGPQAP
jgi:hypothetical protein